MHINRGQKVISQGEYSPTWSTMYGMLDATISNSALNARIQYANSGHVGDWLEAATLHSQLQANQPMHVKNHHHVTQRYHCRPLRCRVFSQCMQYRQQTMTDRLYIVRKTRPSWSSWSSSWSAKNCACAVNCNVPECFHLHDYATR